MDWDAPNSTTIVALLIGVLLGGLVAYGATVTGIVPGNQQPVADPPDSESTSSSLHELANATLWIDGTVERVTNSSIYIDESQYSDVVIPISMGENPGLFRCQSNDSNLSCRPVEQSEVQRGAEVCANVQIEKGTVQAIKVFTNADCAGASSPSQ
ncbi:MAG: hypothetical protein ABEH81_09930 [Halopenitus sp.]